MLVERYSTRRHLNQLTAKMGGHTPAEWANLLRAHKGAGLAPLVATTKTKPALSGSNMAATARKRRLRLAGAEAALAPAPKSKRGPLPAEEACTSITVGGSSFDRAPTVRATDGGAPATSGAARRMNALATDRQVLVRRRRVDAVSRT
jgi:hypothetical protein